MKIARVIYEWPPPWLGLAPAPFELTKSQTKKGHEVDMFCGRWPNAGPVETMDRLKIHSVWRAPFQGTIALTSSVLIFLEYLKTRRKTEFDIIHCHGHFGIWIYAYRRFLQKHFPWVREVQTPLVAHFHNTVKGRKEKIKGSGGGIKMISEFLDWPLAEFSDRLAVATADALIFVSDDLKEEAIKHYNADPKKCYVIESGVNPELFHPADPEEIAKTRIELNLEIKDRLILNAGAIVERKNILMLVEALKLLPSHCKLMLVGTGDDEYVDQIDSYIHNNDLKDRVIKVGYTPYPQVPIAYQAANLFVLPSTFEGMPKVVLEALACGLPVLAAGFTMKESIEGLDYVQELTAEGLAKQIDEMLKNPKRVDIYKASKDHSWDLIADKVDVIYENVKANFLK